MRPFQDLLGIKNCRPRTIGIWFLLIVLLALLLTPPAASFWGVTKSTERGSYYFRLKAKYTYDGQPINFDIVVACSIRVDRQRSGGSSFFATRYPRFLVKRTHDNHELMQIVPSACRGEKTVNGRVPDDFLPGVIVFDKPGDYRLGIAYVSEDAFANPNSPIKFHGASIEHATHADWEAFQNHDADNEGMRRRYYDRAIYPPEEAQVIAESGGAEVEPAYARACFGYARYKLSEVGRAIVRRYWPKNRPRYWATRDRDDGPWPELAKAEKRAPIFANGRRYVEHLTSGSYRHGGFPTRAGGGMINSESRPKYPPAIFPARTDNGIPWVFTEKVRDSRLLVKRVEVNNGPGNGHLYCYTTLNPGQGFLGTVIPNFQKRETRVRVDDDWVVTPDAKSWNWVSPFYEMDEFIYFKFHISLS